MAAKGRCGGIGNPPEKTAAAVEIPDFHLHSSKVTCGNSRKRSFHLQWRYSSGIGKGVIGFFLEKKNHYAQIYAALMRPFCQDLSTCKMWTIQILGVWDPGSEIFFFRLILSFAGAGGCWFQFWNRWCLCCDIITHLYLHQTEECPGSLWRLWGAVGTPFHATFLAKLASV